MIKNEEQMEFKKEYTTPQMEVMTLDVQGALLDESAPESIDFCVGECPGE